MICTRCGSDQAVERHHPMGRTRPGGPYLAPGWTVPLCRACHHSEHQLRRVLDLDSVVADDPIEAVEVGLRRAAITLGRNGDEEVAVALVALADWSRASEPVARRKEHDDDRPR